MNRASAIAIGTIMVVACEPGHGLGSRVDYEIGEGAPYPFQASSIITGGWAGSCLQRWIVEYPEVASLKWAQGTGFEVTVTWPDRTDCTGWWRPNCPRVQPEIEMIDPAVWGAQLTGAPAAAVANVSMKAVGAGTGGFRVVVNGIRFSPDFVLVVDDPVAIMFERANGHHQDQLIPGPISELQIPAGQDGAFAVTLRNAAGEHLCGPLPATVTIHGGLFSIDRFTDGDFVNLPYHIIAGDTPGVGLIDFAVGDIRASLPIQVVAEP